MPRMSDQVVAMLIRPHIPDEAIHSGVGAYHAWVVGDQSATRTGIPLSVNQVYRGIGYLRDHPDPGAFALITERGQGQVGGYVYAKDPQRVEAALRPAMRDIHTRMRRQQTGVVTPYADLVLVHTNPVEADALKRDFADALAVVGRHI